MRYSPTAVHMPRPMPNWNDR